MIAIIPLVLTACSSKKDLGDSEGMTIGQPADLNDGAAVDGDEGHVVGQEQPLAEREEPEIFIHVFC